MKVEKENSNVRVNHEPSLKDINARCAALAGNGQIHEVTAKEFKGIKKRDRDYPSIWPLVVVGGLAFVLHKLHTVGMFMHAMEIMKAKIFGLAGAANGVVHSTADVAQSYGVQPGLFLF